MKISFLFLHILFILCDYIRFQSELWGESERKTKLMRKNYNNIERNGGKCNNGEKNINKIFIETIFIEGEGAKNAFPIHEEQCGGKEDFLWNFDIVSKHDSFSAYYLQKAKLDECMRTFFAALSIHKRAHGESKLSRRDEVRNKENRIWTLLEPAFPCGVLTVSLYSIASTTKAKLFRRPVEWKRAKHRKQINKVQIDWNQSRITARSLLFRVLQVNFLLSGSALYLLPFGWGIENKAGK